MDKLRITYEDPKSLILDPRNARLHPEPNQKAINFSLSEFDFRKVAICVWEKNRTVYAGNALVTEAIRRGYTEVPVAWIPVDWTEAKVKSFGILDNQSALLGEWDLPNLDAVLEEIKLDFDLNDLGFSETDLDILFTKTEELESPSDFKEYDENIDYEIECPSCGYRWSGKTTISNPDNSGDTEDSV